METPKKEQKQVHLIGVRSAGHNILQACELTPDLLKKRLVLITGNTGQGKSTLMDIFKASIAGSDAIKKKDLLPPGFLAESKLVDGDISLYAGVSVGEYGRGDRKGEPKYEVFLYAKDSNGKQYSPIIDGVQATAAKYMSMLTTELTFSLPDLYSENQTTHRKLIEKLFKSEMDNLGADAVVEAISKAKVARDSARALCQGNGAYMEQFESEGLNERQLSSLKSIDTKQIDDNIFKLQIEKDRMVNSPLSDWKLKCAIVDQEHTAKLQAIKDEGQAIREKIRLDDEAKLRKYEKDREIYDTAQLGVVMYEEEHFKVKDGCKDFLTAERFSIVAKLLDDQLAELVAGVSLVEPVKEPPSVEFANELQAKIDEYTKLSSTPLNYPTQTEVDTASIDQKIESLSVQRLGADKNNNLYNRYQLWLSWIEAKGKYEKELDTLRKLYASIDCGVQGMKITPSDTDSGRVEVWLTYNGSYDPEYFHNTKKEPRLMFEYSSFQRTVIGLMLQAARLDLKDKALRLAFVDDVAFTERDLTILSDLAERLDLKLITAWTHEADKDALLDGQVLVDGGEIFFK